MKPGRNDKCPCGSGRKYKKCHLGKEIPKFFDPYTGRSIRERNIILLNAIEDIFFGKGETWDEMRHSMTEDKVKEFYNIVALLWPPQTDLAPLLPKPGKTLRGLYMGDTKQHYILQNIVRYSLYTDEIVVVSPILNPNNIREEHNPIANPKQYRQDTLELIYFARALAPWIVAGIVNVIPDPLDFDFQMRKEIYSMAEQRYEANKDQYEEEVKKMADVEGKEEFRRMNLRMPLEAFRRRFKEQNPDSSQEKVEKFVEELLRQRKADPLLLDEEMTPDAEMKVSRMGANLELGLYLGEVTGSYLYTNRLFQWNEIMSAKQQTTDDSDVWSPLTRAFQQLDFNFLNNVDAKFAYHLQEEGRMGSFRNYLRRVWNKIEEDNTPEQANKAAREFSDELNEEYAIAKEDWEKIDKSIAKFMTGSGATALIAPIIAGGLGWIAPSLGFAVAGVGRLIATHYDRKKFRANVPLAVLLDLEKKDKILK